MRTYNQSEPAMHPCFSRLFAGLAAACVFAAAAPAAYAGSFGFPDQVTEWGHQVEFIYQMLTWIGITILGVVWISLAAAIIKFRKRAGDERVPATWSHNTKLEIAWTVIPFLLIIAVLFPTFKALAYLAAVPKKADLTLEVVGHQFFWEYRYPELGVKMTTTPTMGPGTGEEELYIPTNRKLKVVLTSADVIHSWWVPNFGMQQMTTPGNLAMVPLEISKPGLYEGACTYLCGALHGAMRIKVRAVEPAAFDAWVGKMTKTAEIEPIAKVGKVGMVAPPPGKHEEEKAGEKAEHGAAPVDPKALAAQGKEIYASKCAGCHGATGTGVPGVFPPLAGAEQVTGDPKELLTIILHGKSGPLTVKGAQYNGSMPAWASQLSDQEIAAVATFLRSDFGNSASPVSPAEVGALR